MTVKVPLSRAYEAHGKSFNEVVLREPTYREMYREGLGRPQELQPGPNGHPMLMTYPSTIDAYLQKLVLEPGYDCLGELNPADSMDLEAAVCGFFRERKASSKSPTTSSSSSGSEPQT